MASPRKLETEVEVNCNGQKFWECVRDYIGFLKAGGREEVETVEILAGDGKSAGSIFQVTNKPGHPFPMVKEKIELIDAEKKTVCYSVIGGNVLDFFKSYKMYVTVIPKGDGAVIKLSCEFIKVTDDFSDEVVMDAAIKIVRTMEKFVLKA